MECHIGVVERLNHLTLSFGRVLSLFANHERAIPSANDMYSFFAAIVYIIRGDFLISLAQLFQHLFSEAMFCRPERRPLVPRSCI